MALYRDMRDQIQHLIEVEKLTQRETAERLGIGRRVVETCCAKFGLKTQPRGPRQGPGHPNWMGGRKLVGGYWYVYRPEHPHATQQRCVAEHRLVMEAKIGRYLDPKEVVHHIDGNPQNNHPDNLELFASNADHLRHELTGKPKNMTPDGRRRLSEAVKRRHRLRREREAGDHQPAQDLTRPTS